MAFPRDKMCWAWSLRLWRNKITGLGTKYYSTWPNRACYQILSTGCLPGQHTRKEQRGTEEIIIGGSYSTLTTHVRELRYSVSFTAVCIKMSTSAFRNMLLESTHYFKILK